MQFRLKDEEGKKELIYYIYTTLLQYAVKLLVTKKRLQGSFEGMAKLVIFTNHALFD